MAGKLQQQPVAVIQLGAPVGRGRELFDVGAAKVIGLNGGAYLCKGGLYAPGIDVFVDENAHGGYKMAER